MTVRVLTGDCRARMAELPERSVQCVVTSPPYYGLRAYGTEPQTWADGWVGELGQEPTLAQFIVHQIEVFAAVWRVLRDDGTLWLNMGDSYNAYNGNRGDSRGLNGIADVARPKFVGKKGNRLRLPEDGRGDLSGNSGRGQAESTGSTIRELERGLTDNSLKPKDLMMVPARLAIALQDAGWYLRSDVIWHKSNPMPESVRDRPTSAHEHVFLLTKKPRYYYDAGAVKTPAVSATDKIPDGWNTGPGAHGSFHPNGREKGAKVDKQSGHSRRHDGFNDRWDLMPKAEQQAMGANLRNVWTIATHAFPDAHFATFPPALAEQCIRAGTSEKGACADCGAPWRRVTERSELKGEAVIHQHDRPAADARGVSQTSALRTNGRTYREVNTTGWEPSCDCGADVVPCMVLDPFGGSGTVGLVSERLGRDSILIELKPEYADMTRNRITADAPLFADIVTE